MPFPLHGVPLFLTGPELARLASLPAAKLDLMPYTSLPAVHPMQAAIDWGWCSRGPNVFDGKAAAIMGSGGSGGTGGSQPAVLHSCHVS